MPHVTSRDGTRIAYATHGQGPPLILVDGAFCYREFGPAPKLAPLLAKTHAVYAYDRRGRGESGDAKTYAVEREIEDLRALLDAAGGSAALVGLSSGAVLAMRAAAAGLPVTRLVMYEPPLVARDAPAPVPPDRWPEIETHLAAGRRSDAVKAFMRMVGVPAFAIPLMRVMPGVWSKLTAVAPTLPYDHEVLGRGSAEKPMPASVEAAMRAVRVPTLVGLGGKSPAYMRHTAETVAKTIPGAKLRVLDGQTHNVSEKALAPVVTEFLKS